MDSLPHKIVVASGNPGKLREIKRILADFDIAVAPQSEFGVGDVEETGTSFTENALEKARHAAAATGLAAIGDDSGLAVDALGGRPGVFSARYAGPGASDDDNIDKLLAELADVPDGERGAAFHCVACLVTPAAAQPLLAEGVWSGSILRQRAGVGGFGYDPVFLVPELGCSSAELPPAEKDRRSHRGQALRELARLMQALR
ncbi:MAG: RdgB/HAM1 family non-canonical purine NTP pyrophosphatase [Woeseiaceae bacterium]